MSSQREAQKDYNDEMHSDADVERVRGSCWERETIMFMTLDELREKKNMVDDWTRHRRLQGRVWRGWDRGWIAAAGTTQVMYGQGLHASNLQF